MFCLQFIIRWMYSDIQNKSLHAKNRRNAKELHLMESQSKLCDEIDGNKPDLIRRKHSLIHRIIIAWAYFEVLSLAIILLCKKQSADEFQDNFLNGFCIHGECENNPIVTKIIVYKLFTAFVLIIGSKTKINLLMLPWFFVNVLGIFPFWEIVCSAFYKFEDIKEILNILKRFT
ncbi:uncharacterized protein LOC116347845 [Contarinia nasturtii]|uniref:uncharacterized protein LOC116347845 n=1 Tax=Contarinia nasturtii TaxID=265458 RepID=UPI0012D39444|nr:uncharacterized protein LOC116347845 [Contarinia nasturtii]